MADKIYRSKIDLRVLTDTLEFVFYVSGDYPGSGKQTAKVNKKKWATFKYNTQYPVEAIYRITDTNERLFLRFESKRLNVVRDLEILPPSHTDIILEVFKTNKGVFGFETVKGSGWGAFLSHPNYYNTQISPTEDIGEGALKYFKTTDRTNRVGKVHALQMVLNDMNYPSNGFENLSFDMDILSENCGQYAKSLGFKINLENTSLLEGDVIDIIPVQQVTSRPTDISLTTTYLTLTQKDLVSREVIYDYKKQLTPQGAVPEVIELTNSQVYTVENPLNLTTNLSELNLPTKNIVEIPYNISREVEDGKIKASKEIIKDGKKFFPLNWANELRDNDIFSSSRKCLDLSFANKEQQISFIDKLKQQQIGSIETFPFVSDSGELHHSNRNYVKLSQWINRSKLDTFNDIDFSYTTDGLIDSVTICPKKRCMVNKAGGRENTLKSNEAPRPTQYPNGSIIPNNLPQSYGKPQVKGQNCKNCIFANDGYCNKWSAVVRNNYWCQSWGGGGTNSGNYAPISANSNSDFCFTTYSESGSTTVYSSFTTNARSKYESNRTYDLHISGETFSGNTIIPISDIESQKNVKLMGDDTELYRAYAFSNVYSKNGGYLRINNNDRDIDYMTYTVSATGIYRLTYKAYLDIEYKDTKWCDYLERSYPTSFVGNYPATDYQIKRLINKSIIQEGKGERERVMQDTGFKFNPGYRYKSDVPSREDKIDIPNNTGIEKFTFEASISKKAATGGTPTNLASFSVLRCSLDGSANRYLTLEVNENDKTISGSNVCISANTSASTIFTKRLPVIVDTGFINLSSGETVTLKYDSQWITSSKGGYYGQTGTANLILRLGHKKDDEGNIIEKPYYRVIKSSDTQVGKKLFFDTSKKSKPFKMVIGNYSREISLDGSLYISDTSCGNISTPIINSTTFPQQKFLDTTAPENKLVWDVTSNKKPVNQWQSLVEGNQVKDYTVSKNKGSMVEMGKDGLFYFYLPTYNDSITPTCNFNFPQISQSYIIVNTFKNYFGNLLKHFIVVTPGCEFHKPCSGSKVISAYDIIHNTRPEDWRVQNVDKKLMINGREITVVSSKSHYNPAPLTLPKQRTCKYYCSCGQSVAEQLGINPIYGISNIFTDLEAENCNDCLKEANIYCKNLNSVCEPVLVGGCSPTNALLSQLNEINSDQEIKVNYSKGRIRTNKPSVVVEGEGRGRGRVRCIEEGGDLAGCCPCYAQDTFSFGSPRGGTDLSDSLDSGSPSNIIGWAIECCRGYYDDDPSRGSDFGSGKPNDDGDDRGRGVDSDDGTTEIKYYSCNGGVCIVDSNGIYSSLESCQRACTKVKPPSDVDEVIDEVVDKDVDEVIEEQSEAVYDEYKEISSIEELDSDKGLCPDAYEWCDALGTCIPNNEPCGKYK